MNAVNLPRWMATKVKGLEKSAHAEARTVRPLFGGSHQPTDGNPSSRRACRQPLPEDFEEAAVGVGPEDWRRVVHLGFFSKRPQLFNERFVCGEDDPLVAADGFP